MWSCVDVHDLKPMKKMINKLVKCTIEADIFHKMGSELENLHLSPTSSHFLSPNMNIQFIGGSSQYIVMGKDSHQRWHPSQQSWIEESNFGTMKCGTPRAMLTPNAK